MSEKLIDFVEPLGARPFPWHCPNCGKKAVWRVAVAHHSEVARQGKQFVIELPNWHVPECQECGELVIDYVADDEINNELKRQLREAELNGPHSAGIPSVKCTFPFAAADSSGSAAS